MFFFEESGEKSMNYDGFKPFNFNAGVPYVSVTSNGATFNKAVTIKLNYPAYTQLLINEEEKLIIVKACEEHDLNATQFYRSKDNGILSVRWNNRDMLNAFQNMMGWDLSHESFRIEGTLISGDDAMLFDFKRATLLK